METFTICPVILYAGLGLCLLSAGFLSVAALSRFRGIAARRREENDQRQAEKVIRDRIELAKLLPHPWLDVWDDCKRFDRHQDRALLLKGWLERSITLPRLSFQAIKMLAELVGKSSSDGDFVRAAESLTKYLDFEPCERTKTDDLERVPKLAWKASPSQTTQMIPITCIYCGEQMAENPSAIGYFLCPTFGCKGHNQLTRLSEALPKPY